MIDWKEIYGQVKPFFDMYYQWQVVFVVGEGLFLIFFNYLAYRHLKNKNYAWVIFSLFIWGNLLFVYQSYQKLIEVKIQVVQFQEPAKVISCEEIIYENKDIIEDAPYCPRYPNVKDIIFNLYQEAFDIRSFSYQKIQALYVFENGNLEKNENFGVYGQFKDYGQFCYNSEDFYSKKFDIDNKIEKYIDSLKSVNSNLEPKLLQAKYSRFECEEYDKQDAYFYNHTYSIFIRKENRYYPLLLITKQGEIIYKISDEELKNYIF